MKFFRLDLLTLLISLFILNSCKNEDTIGLAPGSGSLSGTIVDTATIYTNTVLEDTIETSAIVKLPVGFLNDPIFGTTETDIITDLNLPNNDLNSVNVDYIVPTGSIIIDSARLVLKYADGFYGDSLSNFTVDAYQLNQRPYRNTPYYDNKRWSYNTGALLGTLTFQPRPLDSIKIYTIVHGAKDTLIKVAPQIRIPISPSFIQQNLFQASSTVLANNLVFQNNVNGFFIHVDPASISSVGGTMMFQAPADSSLQVYIRATNGTVVDTSLVYLNITEHASEVIHSYSAQVQAALNRSAQNAANHTTTPDSLIYLQGSGGLRTKITLPYIQKLFSSIPGGLHNVVINRAELVVTPTQVPGDIPAYLVPLPKITLYRYDIAEQPYPLQDATTTIGSLSLVGGFGGFYYKATPKIPNEYRFLVTNYIQSIINGTNVDYGTYMAPIDTTNTTSVDIAPTLATTARTIAVGYSKTNPYHITLNVIYTKVKQ
jgi:hypothetical protein